MQFKSLFVFFSMLFFINMYDAFPLNTEITRPKYDWSFGNIYRISNPQTCQPKEHNNKLYTSKKSAKEEKHKTFLLDKNKHFNFVEYVQLVIMKKYPFLDLKEIKRPIENNVLVSKTNLGIDSSLCEGANEVHVEILNRGLSGFAIPKTIPNPAKDSKVTHGSVDANPLNILKEDVIQFENKVHKKML